MSRYWAFVCVVLVNPGCDANGESNPYALDWLLCLNDVQAKGTHNSYHIEPANPIDPSHRYTHAPLDLQLEQQGVRQFELDLHRRIDVGFEVFHLPMDVDMETTCRLFVDCLRVIKDWSDENRWHMPLLIWLEPKDEDFDFVDPSLGSIEGHYHLIEQEILSVWPRQRILTPDEVRKDYPTLPQAILAEGSPTLAQLRGRAIFSSWIATPTEITTPSLLPSLSSKLLFVDATSASDPFAALFKIDDVESNLAQVIELVSAGFIVTSNTDSVDASDEGNTNRAKQTLQAGVHYISSDFPVEQADRAYWFELPDGKPARCNPYTHHEQCTPADIENLAGHKQN